MDPTTTASVLEARRREIAEELRRITEVPRDPAAAVSFGKRVGDGTTEAVERLNAVGTARSLSSMLQDMDRALDKLTEGTYGVCDGCGATIPPERLEAIPWAAYCVRCGRARGPA